MIPAHRRKKLGSGVIYIASYRTAKAAETLLGTRVLKSQVYGRDLSSRHLGSRDENYEFRVVLYIVSLSRPGPTRSCLKNRGGSEVRSLSQAQLWFPAPISG